MGQNQRKRDLIHLQATAYGPTIHPAILRKTSVRFLLNFEKIIKRTIGTGAIPNGIKRSRNLIKIARPDGVIATDSRLVCVGSTTPRRGGRRSHCAAMRLV